MKMKTTIKMPNSYFILTIILILIEIVLNSTEAKPLHNKIEASVKQNKVHKIEDGFEYNLVKQLRKQMLDQEIRNRATEEDHRRMEQWLVDNINDIHRELKQTELDFEHYAQVTKIILAKNEHQIRQQVASIAMQPMAEYNRIY